MNRWDKIRLSLLATTTVAIGFVLLKSLGTPHFVERKETFFVFPETVSLKGWQPAASTRAESLTSNSKDKVFGRDYRYLQNNLSLDIQMRYLPGSKGNVERLVKGIAKSDRKVSVETRKRLGVGSYGVFVYEKKASLSACINPHGYSTFNAREFLQNQITLDVLVRRFIPWLLSGESLRDRRCLWVKLSVPLKDDSPEEAYSTLEQVWLDWYRLWRPRLSDS